LHPKTSEKLPAVRSAVFSTGKAITAERIK